MPIILLGMATILVAFLFPRQSDRETIQRLGLAVMAYGVILAFLGSGA